jgi:cytidine deaminase
MEEKMDKKQISDLIEEALKAQQYSYSPYSNFKVGCALLCMDDSVYHGCNVENCSYGLTNCAERTAIFKAVSEGKKEFKALACIFSTEDFAVPCGACRQVIAEFGSDIIVIMANKNKEYKILSSGELLPAGFSSEHLEK